VLWGYVAYYDDLSLYLFWLVMTVLDENQQGGHHSLKWNGNNSAGTAMPSGVYYCTVEADGYKAVQKMLLVR
jgi:flagellar hook assembly protein FlgD